MGMWAVNAGVLKLIHLVLVYQCVGDGGAWVVSAFVQDRNTRKFPENLCFGGVGGEDCYQGDESGSEGVEGVWADECGAIFGQHDGVQNNGGSIRPVFKDVCEGVDAFVVADHAYFDGVDGEVVTETLELCFDEFGWDGVYALDATGILYGEGGDDAHAVGVVVDKRF